MRILELVNNFEATTEPGDYLYSILSIFGIDPKNDINMMTVCGLLTDAKHNLHKLCDTLPSTDKTDALLNFTKCVDTISEIVNKFSRHLFSEPFELISRHCPGGSLAGFKDQLVSFNNTNTNEFLSILDELHYDVMQGRSIWLYTTFSDNTVRRFAGMCSSSPAAIKKDGIGCVSDPIDFERYMHRAPHHELFPVVITYESMFCSDDLKNSKELFAEINKVTLQLPLVIKHDKEI